MATTKRAARDRLLARLVRMRRDLDRLELDRYGLPAASITCARDILRSIYEAALEIQVDKPHPGKLAESPRR
jgi:hypothetical protein